MTKPRPVPIDRRSRKTRRESDLKLVSSIEEQLKFEQIISELSTRFMGINCQDIDEIQTLIHESLGQLAKILEADLATFMISKPESSSLKHTYQWMAPEIDADVDFTNPDFDLPKEAPWLNKKIKNGEAVIISKLSDFPAEAGNERAIAESLGAKSVIWIPFVADSGVIGCMALNTLREERQWSSALIRRLTLIGQIFENALQRTDTQVELEGRLSFEQLMSSFSAQFVSLHPEQVDDAINDGLRQLGELMKVDRCFLNQFSQDQTSFRVTHLWNADGIEHEEGIFDIVLNEQLPWFTDRMLRGESLIMNRVDEFPEEAVNEKAYVSSVGIQSFAIIPLSVGGRVIGTIGLDVIRVERVWSADVIQQLRLIGEVIANALQRKLTDQKLSSALADVTRLKDQLEAENILLQKEIDTQCAHTEIVGSSPAINSVIKQAEQVAISDSTVLIQGETGTGKELIANLIHKLSQRADKNIIRVNCAALPSALIEAELFGREKGAYTGALSKQVGRFEIAEGSTIFLDEIGELPMELQAKLLRVLQDGEFERLGSTQTLKVDVRVIAATNRDLNKRVKAGEFREDLFYRLNVFPITVPPLRERLLDIPAMVWAFAREYGDTMGKSIDKISKNTMKHLQAYDWPGNVRELRNVIERAMILSQEGVLKVEIDRDGNNGERHTGQTLNEVEIHHIKSILDQTGWRIRGEGGAAQILDINPCTLESRMKKLGIKRPMK